MNALFDKTMQTLAVGLDVASARHVVISNNISNFNTPGFKAMDVDFESTMAEVEKELSSAGGALPLKVTHAGHFTSEGSGVAFAHGGSAEVAAKPVNHSGASMRRDGNSVDVDAEMVKLSENALMYNTMAQVLTGKFSMLRYVINEGRR